MEKELEITEDYTYLTIAVENTELLSEEELWVEVNPGDPASREVEMTSYFVLNQWAEKEVMERIMERMEEDMKKQESSITRHHSQREITDVVCKAYNTSLKMIMSKTRKRGITEARQLICYLLRKLKKKMTYAKIGMVVNREHATVKHAERIIQDRVDTRQLLVNTNKQLNMLIEEAQSKI